MSKQNNNLVCTRIKQNSKVKLEFIKACYSNSEGLYNLSKSDYAALELLLDIEYDRLLDKIKEGK